MIKVFVDESGNMGKSGKYFVMAAVVVRTEKAETRLKRIVKKEQTMDAKGGKRRVFKDELKFSKMKFSQRQRILTKFSKEKDMELFLFVAYKPMVALLREGKTKNLVYNYFSKLLMEKIFKRYDEDFEIIFDQRSTVVKSMNSLTDYIEISAYAEAPKLARRKVTVRQMDSRTDYLLQVADLMSGATAQAYSLKNLHFLEIIGGRIMGLSEFPRRGFVGSLKFFIGRRKLIDKLRGYS